jgi:oligopeptide/dipeptide ABC transporter ATP-binding protein
MSGSLIEGHGLTRTFHQRRGLFAKGSIHAVSGVDIAINRGETVGLVGESGSGKSTVGRLLLGLLPLTTGHVSFDGADLSAASAAELRHLRRRMQLVFQDPFSSLDPRRPVGAQITDGMVVHDIGTAEERRGRARDLLEQVGLNGAHAARYPSEFSGGQRQRIAIARALATQPDFIVADEPVSALDVSVQAQVLTLLTDLQKNLGLAMLFISHDLAVVRHISSRVVILYLGKVMEDGPSKHVFANPRHPYTRALLSATPTLDPTRRGVRVRMKGEPPSPANPPSGCVFRTRCPLAIDRCKDIVSPEFVGPGHKVACIRVTEV